jgi:hypothetical protein
MSTNVPPPSFTATGFVAAQATAIFAGVQADITAAFGTTLNFNLNTPQGQLASSDAAIIANTQSTFCYYTQQVDPSYASGRMQDAIGRIYFLTRNPAEPTSLVVACTGGGAGTGIVLPVGATIVDVGGNIYQLTASITLPSGGGTVDGVFAAIVPGPIAVPAAGNVAIYGVIPGWDSVSVVSGTEGVNVESRQAFEQRRSDSVAGNSLGPIGAIIGAVAEVSGVTDYYGYNNASGSPVTIAGVIVAANSIYICVAGGSPTDIAQAILSKKGGGAGMTGTTTVTAYDDNPLYASPIPYSISFTIASPLQLLFSVELVNSTTVPSNATTLIAQALINAVTEGIAPNPNVVAPTGLRARIGQNIYATNYIAVISQLGAWAQVASILIGSANTPDAVTYGSISGTTFTVEATVSGTPIVTDFLSDPNNLIPGGTEIVSGSGPFTINNSLTVGGTTFTGSGSGTTLTASSVSGVIHVGDKVVGTGIAGTITILAQLTGTPGGAGTYRTSGSTTASGTITTYAAITCASASQTLVQVQANQEPQLVAASVLVSVT